MRNLRGALISSQLNRFLPLACVQFENQKELFEAAENSFVFPVIFL